MRKVLGPCTFIDRLSVASYLMTLNQPWINLMIMRNLLAAFRKAEYETGVA